VYQSIDQVFGYVFAFMVDQWMHVLFYFLYGTFWLERRSSWGFD